MSDKEKIQELKSELFWYNLILFFWLLALVLKIIWIIKKYEAGELLAWKLAILITASLSFLCYFWMRRMKLAKKLKKLTKND